MDALRSLFAQFDIAFNTEALEKGSKAVDSLVDKLTAATKAFAGFELVKHIASFGMELSDQARDIEFGAQKIGMQADEYQKLNQVAKVYGLTTEQLQVSTRMLERALSDTGGTMGHFSARTHFARDAMANLGIDAHQFRGQRLEQILPVLADGFTKIGDPIERTAIALRLFGHRGLALLPLMAQGGANLRREMEAAIPVFEQATLTAAIAEQHARNAASNNWANLINNSIGKELIKTLTWFEDKLTAIAKALKEVTKQSEIGKGILIALGSAITAAGIVGAVAFWSWLWPLAAVGAAFAFIAGAVDDFIVFMKGGDSVIGDFFDEILGPGGAEKAQQFFKDLWEDIKGFGAELKEWGIKEFFDDAKEGVKGLRDFIAEIRHDIEVIDQKMQAFDDWTRKHLGLGTSDEGTGRAVSTVADAFQPGGATWIRNPGVGVAPPPVIGPPTAQQDAANGNAPSLIIPVDARGNIGQEELIHGVRNAVAGAVTQHHERVMRDTAAAFGGAQ